MTDAALRCVRPETPRPPDVTRLDDAAVLARLFPAWPPKACVRRHPPAGWRPWQAPAVSLPIDAEVTRLVAPGHPDAPRLQREILDGLVLACPFFAARQAVAWAAHVGRHEATRRSAGEAAAVLADDVGRASAGLRRILARLPADVDRATTPLDRRPDPIAAFASGTRRAARRSAVLVAVQALDDEAAELRAAHARSADAGRGHAWRCGFVRALGFAWFAMTGRQPRRGDGTRFADFVAASALSLDEHAAEEWASPIKRAIREVNAWPQWAGFDRLVTAGLPGVVLTQRRYPTAEAARIGAGRMADRLVRAAMSPDVREALKGHGQDLVDLAVATAGDSDADFATVLAAARRVADFQRGVMLAARDAIGMQRSSPVPNDRVPAGGVSS